MDLDIKRIIDLHKIDEQMLEIHEGKGDLPNIINDQEYKIDELNEKVIDNKEALETLNKNINQLNIKTEEFSSGIEKHNSQIYSVKNNKEYEAIIKEIDYLKEQNNENNEGLKNAKEEKESLNSFIEESENKINELSSKLNENKEELKVTSALTEKEENDLNNSKEKLLKEINDKKFVTSYKEGNNNFKLSPVSRDSCSNCFSSLPPQFILNVKEMNKLYVCPSCGVNLYWDE